MDYLGNFTFFVKQIYLNFFRIPGTPGIPGSQGIQGAPGPIGLSGLTGE